MEKSGLPDSLFLTTILGYRSTFIFPSSPPDEYSFAVFAVARRCFPLRHYANENEGTLFHLQPARPVSSPSFSLLPLLHLPHKRSTFNGRQRRINVIRRHCHGSEARRRFVRLLREFALPVQIVCVRLFARVLMRTRRMNE